MKQKLNSEVAEYIEKSEEFAKPILKYCRKLILDNCPEVVETIKWGIPHYDYKSDFMIVIASYKNHCSFSFIKAELMNDPRLNENKKLKPIQRYLGKITKLSELPKKEEFIGFITDAKTPTTRQKRIDESLEWIAEGKGRFWKYQK